MSIDSQEAEIRGIFADRTDIELVGVFREAYSAKAPGRAIFGTMLERIENGEADGIIAWHPDRLARNSIDGGRIIYLLDTKTIKDLKFASFGFENTSQGKLMLSVLFGFSKYYVDSLSENVKRGNRAKLKQGWRPNHAPIGYRNDRMTKTIVKDPERFGLVRKLFDLALTGSYSVRRLTLETRSWGLKTIKRKRIGGKYLSVGNIHHVLTNPFYMGVVMWDGTAYPGAHEPMVTRAEFAQVQAHLGRFGKVPVKKCFFPLRGMIRCGECGLSVTAEDKINRYGSRYTYYHCTKKRLDYQCTQRSITAQKLDEAFLGFLGAHTLPQSLHSWTLEQIQRERSGGANDIAQQKDALQRAYDDAGSALHNLTSLKIRDLIDEEDFLQRRKALLEEQKDIQESLAKIGTVDQWFEPAESVVSFNNRAVIWYQIGDAETKWQIASAMGSNLTLNDRKASIEALEPFISLAKNTSRTTLCRALDTIRTLYTTRDPVFMRSLAIIRLLHEKYQEVSTDSLPASCRRESAA